MTMTFPPELLDELLKGYQNPEDLLGEGGILKQLTQALVERCLEAEMKTHMEEQRAESASSTATNRRNGHSKKTIKGEFGEAEIAVPRDRTGEFEPQIVKKGQTRFDGFDDKILSLYARGMTVRDIQSQLLDLYGVEVSAGLISNVTEAVEEERKAWQNRPLEALYPIVYFDALRVKLRHEGRVINKSIYLALAVNLSGSKELLGLWVTQNESAKFWLQVLTELQNRGLKDIFIACIDMLLRPFSPKRWCSFVLFTWLGTLLPTCPTKTVKRSQLTCASSTQQPRKRKPSSDWWSSLRNGTSNIQRLASPG
jgi:transposase-like protein